MKPWSWAALALWFSGGAFFIAVETLGMLKSKDQFPTLTNVIKRWVPKWALAMVLGWLAFHFLAGEASDR